MCLYEEAEQDPKQINTGDLSNWAALAKELRDWGQQQIVQWNSDEVANIKGVMAVLCMASLYNGKPF